GRDGHQRYQGIWGRRDYTAAEVVISGGLRHDWEDMDKPTRAVPGTAPSPQDLIALAQKLARDAERHALLSASLASQADRLMVAGLERLRTTPPSRTRGSC